jgi:hypothetical protein
MVKASDNDVFHLCQPDKMTDNDIQYYVSLNKYIFQVKMKTGNSEQLLKYSQCSSNIAHNTVNNQSDSVAYSTYSNPKLILDNPKEITENILKLIPETVNITTSRSVKKKLPFFWKTSIKRSCCVQFKFKDSDKLKYYTIDLTDNHTKHFLGN